MSEAGDGPETFSGLEEIVRPLSFEDDGLSADQEFATLFDSACLDSSEEDTVFLAPRRDFSPSGMARDEGADADIDSPFAATESKTVSELMSPVRQADGDPDGSQHVFEAKAPTRNPELVVPLGPLRQEPSPSNPPAPPPIAETASTRPLPAPPNAPAPSSPFLTRPRLVQPTPEQSAVAWPKAPPSSTRRRPVVGNRSEMTPSVDAPSPEPDARKMPPLPAPASHPPLRDQDALPMRQIDALQPKTEPAPVWSPPPGRLRLAIGAMAQAGSAFRVGLGTAWTQYSGGCLQLQSRLSQLAGGALIQARSLASYSGSALVSLGHQSAQGSRIGGACAWKATKATARHASVLAKAAQALARQGFVHVTAFMRQILALVAKAWGNLRLVVERWLAARAQRREEAAEAAKAAQAAKVAKAIDTSNVQAGGASTPPEASGDPSPAAKALGSSVAVTSAMAVPPTAAPAAPSHSERVHPTSTSVDARAAEPRWRLLSGLEPRHLSLAGLAAASIAFLIAAVALSPTTGPASAALTFPIPKKPIIGAIPVNRAESLPKPVGTVARGEVPPLLELKDPIKEMLAYVGEGTRRAPAVSDNNPVLARAGTEEGLSQFVRAVEVVGLKELLEPGEAYTIFAPNDEAFARLAPGEFDDLLEPAGHERLLTLLSHHVLPGRLNVGDFQGEVHEHTSLAGQALSIDATEVVRIGGARMIEADLPAENGVLHVIDQVLAIVTP